MHNWIFSFHFCSAVILLLNWRYNANIWRILSLFCCFANSSNFDIWQYFNNHPRGNCLMLLVITFSVASYLLVQRYGKSLVAQI